MKTNKILSGLFMAAVAMAGLSACTSDEPLVKGPEQSTEIPTFEGDQAAMTIRIFAPTSGTRAISETSGFYEDGSADENKISNIDFYFYDAAGNYVTSVEQFKAFTPMQGVNQGTGTLPGTGSSLVEVIGESKITLTNLIGKNYPSYVVAVINYNITGTTQGANNIFKKTLADVSESAVLTRVPWAVNNAVATNFVMTSATHNNNTKDGYWFATALEEDNFAVQPNGTTVGGNWVTSDGAPAKAVEIYVERLAAKIEMKFPGFALTEDEKTNQKYYQIKFDQKLVIDGVQDPDQEIYFRLLGWAVNGQARQELFFKKVNDNFKTNDGWDYAGTNRCYWAITPGYGTTNYPHSFENVGAGGDGLGQKIGDDQTGEDLENNDYIADGTHIQYISWNDVISNGMTNSFAYVLPHTEVGSRIQQPGNTINHPAITEVLVAAQIVNKDGEPITLFQIGKNYYTETGAVNYVLSDANANQTVWKKTADNKYVSIDASDVDVTYGYDGGFKLKFSNQGNAVAEWYVDDQGTKYANKEAVLTHLNSYLPSQQSFCYKEGRMYYNIPVKHILGNSYDSTQDIKTGMFGVVRNHWYQVSVTSVKNLGHAVYRPEEHIIPPSDPTRYMIGSSIRILSWRMVTQTEEL